MGRQPRYVLEENDLRAKDLGETGSLKNQARSLVQPSLAVLAAERLTRRANHQKINIFSIENRGTNFSWVDLFNVALNHTRARVVDPVCRTGHRIIVYGCDHAKMPTLQRGGYRSGSAIQIYGCRPSASRLPDCFRCQVIRLPIPRAVMNQQEAHRKSRENLAVLRTCEF